MASMSSVSSLSSASPSDATGSPTAPMAPSRPRGKEGEESCPWEDPGSSSSQDHSEDEDNANSRRKKRMPKIWLNKDKKPVDISQLTSREGVVLEPTLDKEETNNNNNHNNDNNKNDDKKNRFSELLEAATDEELAQRLEQLGEFQDEDDSFEAKEARMTKVTPDGGVSKRLMREGGREPVPPTATVSAHYSLYLEHADEPFDSTLMRGRPETFRLGSSGLWPGLDIALGTMRKRERAEFLVKPEYAFGQMGCPPRIPGGASIRAVVEMLNFVEDAQPEALLALPIEERYEGLPFAKVLEMAQKLRVQGNDHVKAEEWKSASKRYLSGIRLLEDAHVANDDEEDEQKRLLQKLLLNRGLALLKVHWPKKAAADLSKALELDPHNAKTLYRLGKAKRMAGHTHDARRFLRRAQELTDDADVARELELVERECRRINREERELCARMMGADVGGDADDDFMEEAHEQLEGFKASKEKEMQLPTMSGKELQAVKRMATAMDLYVDEHNDKLYVSK